MALLPFNSTAGYSVGEIPVTIIDANGNITANRANFTANVNAAYYFGNGAFLEGIDTSLIANGNSNVKVFANGNIAMSVGGNANIEIVTSTGVNVNGYLNVTGTATLPNIVAGNITTASNANLVLDPNGTGLVVIANTAGGAIGIELGDPTQGNMVSNAVTLTNSTSVSNSIALLNFVLGKLVPPQPPAFPASQNITIQNLSTYRMCNFTQTDNTPGANKSVAGGTTVTTVRRAASYNANVITTAGPGNQGTVTAFLNGTGAGNVTLTNALTANGTYGNLVIFNNYDYNVANVSITPNFWSVFSARAAGSVTEGWNEVYIADSAAGNTNTAVWYYDASTPGTPTFSSQSITAPASPSFAYSSTVPHYDSSNQFDIAFNVTRLSGDMYPTSDTFVTGTAGGAFGAPASVTYALAGVATPLSRNLYVASGSQAIATTSSIISGFGSSLGGPSVTVTNSYNNGTDTFLPGSTVLYKTGTASSATRIEEANVYFGGTIGSGSGLAYRIVSPGSTDTPVFTGSEAAFNSQSGSLQNSDATVVANILKHDQTDYSTGYLPVGPDLSGAGRAGTQYFTFKFIRTSVSKFDIKWSGTLAGLFVALPGSAIDTSSTLNGWLDASIQYQGAGVPGAGTGGNGSNGCALGTPAPLNSLQTNRSITISFGTESSSDTVTNEIYVRIKLTSGQSITALSLQPASN